MFYLWKQCWRCAKFCLDMLVRVFELSSPSTFWIQYIIISGDKLFPVVQQLAWLVQSEGVDLLKVHRGMEESLKETLTGLQMACLLQAPGGMTDESCCNDTGNDNDAYYISLKSFLVCNVARGNVFFSSMAIALWYWVHLKVLDIWDLSEYSCWFAQIWVNLLKFHHIIKF